MRPTSNSPNETKNLREGKREHERHSGSNETGVKSIDKRHGGGAHNWGNVKDDIKDYNETSIKNSGKSQVVETNISIVKEKPNVPNLENSSPKINVTQSGDLIEEKTNNEDGKRSAIVIHTKEETTIVKDDKSFPSLPVKK